jgi:hypothetical protein
MGPLRFGCGEMKEEANCSTLRRSRRGVNGSGRMTVLDLAWREQEPAGALVILLRDRGLL